MYNVTRLYDVYVTMCVMYVNVIVYALFCNTGRTCWKMLSSVYCWTKCVNTTDEFAFGFSFPLDILNSTDKYEIG